MEATTFAVLVHRWLWIAVGACLGVIVAAVLVLAQPHSYLGTVEVVPNRARTEVDYETRIRTVSENGQSKSGTAPSVERRQALASLVRNPDIESAVQEELSQTLPPQYRQPGSLIGMVSGALAPRSEIITITVSAPTARLAEGVAAAWARAYERHVNRLYATGPWSSEIDLQRQVEEAGIAYRAAEDALTAFLGTSRLSEYGRLLESNLLVLGDRQLLLQEQARALRRTELLLGDAIALQQHLDAARDGGAALTNTSALVLLKMQAFTELLSAHGGGLALPVPAAGGTITGTGSSTTTPSVGQGSGLGSTGVQVQLSPITGPTGVQVQLSPITGPTTLAQQRDDVAAVIHALENRRTRLQQELLGYMAGRETAGNAVSPVDSIEQEIRALQGKTAELAARQRALQQQRDLALETYTSLVKKAEEAKVSSAIGTGKEVNIASRTVVATPAPRMRLSRAAILGGGAGAALAGAAALVAFFGPSLYRKAEVTLQAAARANGYEMVGIADRPASGVGRHPVDDGLKVGGAATIR